MLPRTLTLSKRDTQMLLSKRFSRKAGTFLQCDIFENTLDHSRFVIQISKKKIKTAVMRNVLRRRVSAWILLHTDQLPVRDYRISYRAVQEASFHELAKDLELLV
jgi:ribonuclease P protein component